MLRHPDIQKPFVIIPHANRWAACAVIGQEHDGKIQPVRYTGRVLNDAELRYHIRSSLSCGLYKYFGLFWKADNYKIFCSEMGSKSADGRCVPWGVTLSHWDIEIRKVQKDEDGLAAIMGAGITPREHLDEAVETLIPLKGHVRYDFDGVVLSFDGAAKLSTKKEVAVVCYGSYLDGRS
ncbi:LOW QUALITY PROTEIN: reverse transcriptase [Phytophthora megakarya]|uniref:Reverse transcriptase n=1 Tax=Phytophthora megakarya TaxID=4795 RepID=A0A225UCZ7_9STRA|nr:LOW QUALITY PROTEIN: reverse transcriptase [Phytophthora megakarya]